MRHRNKTVKLQRDKAHRDAMMRNLACSLIEHRRVRTTVAKAKALRPFADKLVTLGKSGTLHHRRRALSLLGSNKLAQKSVTELFDEIAAASKERNGGYTRITKLGQRTSDAAPMAYIEWVDAFTFEADDEDDDLEEGAEE